MAITNVVTRGYGPSAGIRWIVTKGYFAVAGVVTAMLSGSSGSNLTEAEIVAGGETIILTLTNATWVAAGATFDAQRQNIIDGMTSGGVEAAGWNAEVRDKEVVGAVVRTSDTVVTITLTAQALYDVTTSEVVTITIPGTALSTGDAVVASPTLVAGIQPSTGEMYPFVSGGFTANRFLLGRRR